MDLNGFVWLFSLPVYGSWVAQKGWDGSKMSESDSEELIFCKKNHFNLIILFAYNCLYIYLTNRQINPGCKLHYKNISS